MERTFSLDAIDRVADELAAVLRQNPSAVMTLEGGMGAGKTTLVSALMRALGSADTVSSPTFAIINEYRDSGNRPVYHMDWYRLSGEEEAIDAGVEDALLSGYPCLVEWPDRAPELIPADAIRLQIHALPDGRRQLRVAELSGQV